VTRRRWSGPLLFGFLLLLGLGVYAPSFDNGFRADDFVFLAAVIDSPSPLALWAPQADIAFYRPLALQLFAVEYRLFGLAGGLYLVFNVLLQAGAAGLGLLLLRRLGLGPLAAAGAAGAFFLGVSHYGKQVTWACASGGLLALVLLLAALLLAEPSSRQGRWRQRLRWTAVLAIALLAPFSHEAGLLIGPLLALRRLLGGAARGRGWLLGAALFLPALGLWLWATQAAGSNAAEASLQGSRLAAVLGRYLRHFGLALLPLQGDALAGTRAAALATWLQIAQLVLGALVVAACAARLAQRKAPAGQRFLAAWALAALAPYALVPLPSGWLELRYLHAAALPLAGLAASLLAGDHVRRPRWAHWTAGAVAAAYIVAALGIGSVLERRYDREARSPENQARLAAIQRELALPR
jgi:hypothetical protein